MYCIDIDTYEYRTMDVSYIEGTITKVFFYNNKYWFLLKDNCDIYASDGKSDSYIKYSSESPEYVENRNSIQYSNMIQWGETLILLNYYGKYIMKVSEEKHTLKRVFPDFNQEGGVQSEMLDYGACYYQAATLSNNTIYFIPQRATHIIECDKELEITNRYECVITEKEVLDEILLLMLEEKDALMEGMKVATLQRYIDNIDKLQKEMLNSDCGGKIYSEIRK